MGLLCSHLIQQQMRETECIHLTDIDPHWWYEAPTYTWSNMQASKNSAIDPLLQIANPPRVCIQGHPAGTVNLNHQQQKHEWSTRCDPSRWEVVDVNIQAQLQAEEQAVEAWLELTTTEAIGELLQVNRPSIQTDEVNNMPEAQRVDIVVEDLTTSNATKPLIQSNKELLNQVTAPHCQGKQARQLIKCVVEADINAEASQWCCKQARKV